MTYLHPEQARPKIWGFWQTFFECNWNECGYSTREISLLSPILWEELTCFLVLGIFEPRLVESRQCAVQFVVWNRKIMLLKCRYIFVQCQSSYRWTIKSFSISFATFGLGTQGHLHKCKELSEFAKILRQIQWSLFNVFLLIQQIHMGLVSEPVSIFIAFVYKNKLWNRWVL